MSPYSTPLPSPTSALSPDPLPSIQASPQPPERIPVKPTVTVRPSATTLPALPSVVPNRRPTPAPRPPVIPLMPPIPIIPPPPAIPRPIIPAPPTISVPVARDIRVHIGTPPAPSTPRPPIPVIPIPPVPLRRRRPGRQAPAPLPRRPPLVAVPRPGMPRATHAVPARVRIGVHPRRTAVRLRATPDSAALGRGRERSAPVLELAPVEFVALLKGGEVSGVRGEGRHLEVGVLEGVACVYPRLPVEFEELLEERDGSGSVSADGVSLGFIGGAEAAWTYSLNRVERLPGLGRGDRTSAPGRRFHPGMFSSVGPPMRSQISSS